jgi:hypothetical protein
MTGGRGDRFAKFEAHLSFTIPSHTGLVFPSRVLNGRTENQQRAITLFGRILVMINDL